MVVPRNPVGPLAALAEVSDSTPSRNAVSVTLVMSFDSFAAQDLDLTASRAAKRLHAQQLKKPPHSIITMHGSCSRAQ
jgi:hypothetical protein